MAHVIEDFIKTTRGRPRIYDWETWANGENWCLQQGQDFACGLFSFRMQVHRHARLMGKFAYTSLDQTNKTIKIRFYNR